MRKVLVVAMREYQAAVKTKAFLLSLVLMPVMMGGSIFFQMMMRDKVDIAEKRVALVDQSGRLYDALKTKADLRNQNNLDDEKVKGIFEVKDGVPKQVQPKYLLERFEAGGLDHDQLCLRLSDRVRANEIFAFVIIPADITEPKGGKPGAPVQYYSNSPTYDEVQEWFIGPVNEIVQAIRVEKQRIDPTVLKAVTERVWVGNLGLVSVDESGTVTKAKETNRIANFFVPMGLMMLMFMVVMVGASPLMQSVLEEKMNRIAEVLLGSVSPFGLMLGKLLGMVGVSLTIATVYMVGAFLSLKKAGYGEFFPAQVIWWFVVYQSLAVLMFGALFIAIGAAVSDMKEAQSLMTPVMILVVAPMFVWTNVVKEPLSTMSTVFSLFPPATPMLMVMRQAIPPGIPVWQPLVGIVGVVLTTLFCVFAASRIFRVGILMQGKGAKVSEMVRWVFRG